MRIPLPALIILILLSVAIDWLIYVDLRRFTRKGSRWKNVYAISAVICWVFLIVTFCLPRRDEDQGILTVMWMLYSYITVYVAKFIYVVCSFIGRLAVVFGKKRLNTGMWLGVPFGLLAFCAMWWGVAVTRHEVRINDVTLLTPNLPEEFNGYRIAQISDLHVGTWGNDTSFVATLVNDVNEQHPDLIVFTGDLVNRQTSELEPFLKTLSRLHAPDGVYSVLGNHDYGDYVDWKTKENHEANNALLAAWERQMGWQLLRNEHSFIHRDNDSIVLIGVENWGEPPFHQYGDLRRAYPAPGDSLGSLNDNRFKILLSHNPEHWNREVADETNIDLTLSGHTHAMQFMLTLGNWKWSPAKYRYEQWGGLYSRERGSKGGNSFLYVNIGAGEVALPYRIGAVPEVTVITLRKFVNQEN